MNNAWLMLALAITAEVIATTSLKASEGFSRPLPSVLTVCGYAASFWLLSQILKKLEVGIVYAVWSGVGLAAVEKLRPLVPEGASLAQLALRWILMDPAVTVVIPGARNPQQALANIAASELPALTPEAMETVARVYDQDIRPHVHPRW